LVEKNGESNYKWYILTLSALTHIFVMAVQNSCLPVLFQEISEDLNLSIVQLGTVWGMVGLGAIFIILIGGLLGDKFGVKRTLSVVCFLAGLAGALRGFSVDFFSLAATTFLFGLMSAFIPTISLKSINIWFPRRQLGLANSIITISVAVGLVVGPVISATVMSPLLGGWRNVLFLYGAIAFLLGFAWLLIRSGPEQSGSLQSPEKTVPLRQVLLNVVRNRNIWLLGIIFMGHSGCAMGMRGYLPLYLRQRGWTETNADGALAATSVASIVGVFPIAFLSHKFGSRKALILATVLMTTIGVGLLSVADGLMIWISVVIAGFVWDGYMAILHTTIMETEGIDVEHTATAVGLVHTIGRLGIVISPPIGNSLASINPSLAFIFWAAMAIVPILCCIYFLKDTGWRTESIYDGTFYRAS